MRLLSRLFYRDPDRGPEVPEFVQRKSAKPHVHLVPAECDDEDCWFCKARRGEP